MTEPIIINDVDVSKCKLFTQEYNLDFSKCGHICKDTFCKYKHNYLLKKLNRKEQECEKLTDALLKIKKCAVTGMVEITTRADYNGFLALQGITAKVNQVLKINKVGNER